MAKLTSPFEKYPGEILIPDELDAEQFNVWWTRNNELREDEDDTRYPLFHVWDCRFHFIVSHTIELPDGYELEQSGLKLPTPLFAEWFVEETNKLIGEANDLKNYLGLSDDT